MTRLFAGGLRSRRDIEAAEVRQFGRSGRMGADLAV